MKKLMFFALAAASLALHASVEVLDLKKGLTAPEFSTGVRAIERIEAVSYVDNATLTVKRIRGLVDIPYFSHRTNDGEAVDWKILDGTTYDNHPEELLLPLKKRTGGTLTTNTFTRFRFATVFWRGVRFDAIEHANPIVAEGSYCDRIASYVFYYFGDDCLYTSATADLPQHYSRFANPRRFDYDSSTKLLAERRQRDGTVPYVATNRSVVAGACVTNAAQHVQGSANIEEAYARAGVPVPPARRYGVIPAGATGVYEVVTMKKRIVRTENIARMVGPDGNVVDTWNVEEPTSATVQEGSFTNHVVFWAPFDTTSDMFVTPFGNEYYSENAFKSTADWTTSNVLVRTETTYYVDSPKVVLDTDKYDVNMYVPALFGRYGLPTNLVYDAAGNTTKLGNNVGNVVTNFAVWSTFTTQATNTFYTTTMRRGSVVSTNFVNAGYLLPGDRMVVEGTALPTGQVKMYLNTKE